MYAVSAAAPRPTASATLAIVDTQPGKSGNAIRTSCRRSSQSEPGNGGSCQTALAYAPWQPPAMVTLPLSSANVSSEPLARQVIAFATDRLCFSTAPLRTASHYGDAAPRSGRRQPFGVVDREALRAWRSWLPRGGLSRLAERSVSRAAPQGAQEARRGPGQRRPDTASRRAASCRRAAGLPERPFSECSPVTAAGCHGHCLGEPILA